SGWKVVSVCRPGAGDHGCQPRLVLDSVVLVMTVRRSLGLVGKVEYLDSWKTRRLLPAFGMIPVDGSDGRCAVAALKTSAEVLRAGGMFAIYPEGTRSAGGDLHTGPHRRGLPLERWPYRSCLPASSGRTASTPQG